jgi:protein TonB
MSEQKQTPPAPASRAERARSFIGWAFLISLVIHAIALPFFGLKHQEQQKEEVEKVSVSKKIKVVAPTPPPPTPPPPTPPPKQTPPPVKQTNPPPQPKLKVQPPKTTSKSNSASSEKAYVPPPVGSENGVPQGTVASAAPAPPAPANTAPPATPAPTPTPTPKPQCAVPNADAAIKGQPVEPDYPDIARQQGAVGTTQVKVTLAADGSVASVSVYKSSGNQALDNSAMKAARDTAYTPEIVNCVKTAGSYIFRADFSGQ